jgi:hypothetical protein
MGSFLMNIGKKSSETSLQELPFGTAPFLRSPERRRKEAGGGVGGAAPDRRPPWAEVRGLLLGEKKPARQKSARTKHIFGILARFCTP